jgi:hypothetical protein
VAGRETRFRDVQRAVAVRREIALGLRIDADWKGPRGGVALNPDRDRLFALTTVGQVVVLTRT